MTESQEAAARFMATVSSPAGIYDYLLGGVHYSDADKIAAEKALAIVPDTQLAAQENRAFLQRAVRYAARQGVTQYVDLGSGYPTAGAVDQVAQQIVPHPHVVYVDYDPVVAMLGREVLTTPETVAVVHDIRHPGQIIADPEVIRRIDWSRPVAVLMVAILHFIADCEDPAGIIATFRDQMVPGSYLVISHVSRGENPERTDEAARVWDRSKSPLTLRTASEIARFFAGFELVPPGLVPTSEWDTGRTATKDQSLVLAGVGRRRPP